MNRSAAGRWPTSYDYDEAVQNPGSLLADEELRQGVVARNSLGLPLLFSGAFANVYRFECPHTGNLWAVKFFTREKPGLRERYQAISDQLALARLPFMVDFRYVEQGVRIHGEWYPLVKLPWIEGIDLNRFVGESAGKPRLLEKLSELWVKLAARLRAAGIAHADLQHGNALLVPRDDQGNLSLKLIDYDGMWVPSLEHQPSGETGHRNYQHPRRATETPYSPAVDRFSHLAVCCALRCVRAGGTGLWDRFNNGENLLFRERDFADPAASELFQELWTLRDPAARALVGHLTLAARRPLEQTPWIDDLIDAQGNVRPLADDESDEVRELLAPTAASGSPSLPPPTDISRPPAEVDPAELSSFDAPFALLPPPVVVPPSRLANEIAQARTWAYRHGGSLCAGCHSPLAAPDSEVVMATTVDARGDFVSPLVTIRRTKAFLMLEDEIRWQGGTWPFPQPAGHLPRSSVVALSAATAGLAILVGVLLVALSAGFAGSCVIIFGVLAALFMVAMWHPRADAVLAVVWEVVVPRLLQLPPSPEVYGFLAGLARTSERAADAGRTERVASALRACEEAFEKGRATYPYFAALYRLQLIDALRFDRARAFDRVVELVGRWRRGETPTACLDLATADGTLLDLFSPAERRRLKWRFLGELAAWGLGPLDVESLAQRSRMLHRLVHAPEGASVRFVTLALAIGGLAQEVLADAGAESVFYAAQRGERWFAHGMGPYLRSSDGEFEIDEEGLRFRERRVKVDSRIDVRENKEFVQTGWTHQRRDGGPDQRYKHNPPIGYQRTIGYVLNVDGQTWTYREHPRDVLVRLERWRMLSFQVLSPRVDELLRRPPSPYEEQLRPDNQVRCPHCGTTQVFVPGEFGAPVQRR